MGSGITYLPRLDKGISQFSEGADDHPMRKVTQEVAFTDHGWSSDRAGRVAKLFDEMAEGWGERNVIERRASVLDALSRGGVTRGRLGMELGSGTGAYSKELTRLFESLLCIDISFEMLVRAPSASGYRVRGDGSSLPVSEGSVDGMFFINTLLFPSEIKRVLTRTGYLVWVSTNGDQTPIYLSPDEVLRALGGGFVGISSQAGSGIWTVFRRVTV